MMFPAIRWRAILFLLLCSSASAGIDVARQPILSIRPGGASTELSILGVSVGMTWEEARVVLNASQTPWLFSKRTPLTVYIRPLDPSVELFLDPVTFTIREIWISGNDLLPVENHFLTNGDRWRLTNARTFFFGSEGREIRNEEGFSYVWPERGFALKYLDGNGFHFVMTLPAGAAPRIVVKEPAAVPPPSVVEGSFPSFITGYYFPSLPKYLHEFEARKSKGAYRQAPYIRDDDPACISSGGANNDNLTAFVRDAGAALEAIRGTTAKAWFYVNGYTDQRELLPGRYLDKSIAFGSMAIAQGDRIPRGTGNTILSWLRAYYTYAALHEALMQTPAYVALKDQGRIVWELHGLGVDHGKKPLREKRRSDVRMHIQ